jgi:kynurenine formamidase
MRPSFVTGAVAMTTAVSAAFVWNVIASQAPSPAAAPPALVTKAQFDRWKTELSNWGRWGKDDQMGALNLITPAKRKQASALVREGVAVSLARDANEQKDVDNPNPYERTVFGLGPAGVQDRFAVSFHGLSHTHMDALAHRFFDGRMYNGIPADEVTEAQGAPRAAIHVAREGIFTRGVLMDMPALKGVPYLEPATRITVQDLEAWERKAGVKAQSGDALFIRVGRWARRDALGPWPTTEMAGLDASVIPWLKQRDIAVLASEAAVDARPAPEGGEIGNLAVHDFVQVVLGVHVFDNTDLTALSAAAASRKRWEFLLTVAPIRFRYGTGSPVNPIALF